MSSEVSFIDILLALEPTGFFTPDASIVLVLLASLIILTLASLFVYAYRKNIKPRLHRAEQLNKLLNILEQDYPQLIKDSETWDNQLNNEIRALPWLHERWEEFRGHCLVQNNSFSSFEEPADYFQELAPPPAGFSANVSSMLTAIGILGTFLGITIGLGQVGAGMNEASSEQMQNAMSQLIQSLGVSFRTSIWGLILSMITSAGMSRADASLDVERLRWVAWLDKAVPRSRMHDFALEQITIMNQTKGNTEVLVTQGETFQTAFQLAIYGNKSKPGLISAILEIGDQIAAQQTDGLEKMVNEFMRMMQKQMGADFGQLGATLKEIVTANQQFQSTMQSLIEQLSSASSGQDQSAAHMQQALQSAALAISEMQGSLSGLSGVTSSIQEAANAMSSMLSQQTKASSAQNNTMDNLVTGLEAQSSEILSAYSQLHSQFGDLSGAITGLVDWHKRIKESLAQQVALFIQATEAQRVISSELSCGQQTALSISAQLAQSTNAIGPAATELTRAGGTIRQASEGLFTTEAALRGLTTALEDASRELTDRQLHAIGQFSEINTLLQNVLQKGKR